MVTIVNQPVTGPVNVNDDALYVTGSGSVTFPSGLAIDLQGNILAYINGDVTGDAGIKATGDGYRYVSIGAFSTIQFGENYPGIEVGGNTIVRNNGNLIGDSVAVGVSDPSAGWFTNGGIIHSSVNSFGIVYDSFLPTTYTIRNFPRGQIISDDQPTIWSTVPNLTLDIDNHGLIESSNQAIYIYGKLNLENNGAIIGTITAENYQSLDAPGASEGSRIINKGLIEGEQGEPTISLGGGNDFVRNEGTIVGEVWLGAGDDKFFGSSDAEIVYGGIGRDLIMTKGAADVIIAGPGEDLIIPGAGADLIIHKVGDGTDAVLGFKPGEDMLDLSDHDYFDFDDLKSDITETPFGLVFDLTGPDSLFLPGVKLADLSDTDFNL